MAEIQRRDVVEIRERRGPRGGRIYLLTLDCGHGIWLRGRKQPPRTVECVSCWMLAIEDEEGKCPSDS